MRAGFPNALRRLFGLFGPGLGTTGVLVWMGLGALLIFFGVALFSSRIARPLAALVSPIGLWVFVLLSVLVFPFFTLPYWLLRYAFFGPGPAGYRVGPGEVEECRVRDAAVSVAAAIGVPDETRGQVVKAFVVLAPGASGSDACAVRKRT